MWSVMNVLGSPYNRLPISSPLRQPSHSFFFTITPRPMLSEVEVDSGVGIGNSILHQRLSQPIICITLAPIHEGRQKMTTPLNLRRGLAVLVALGFQCFLVNAQEQQAISGIGAQRCAILNARATAGANPNDM